MKKRVGWLLLMVLMLSVLSLGACVQKVEQSTTNSTAPEASTLPVSSSPEVKGPKEISIGAITLTSEHVFFNLIEESLKARASELGVKIDVKDGQSDSNVQYNEVQNFITAGVDAIILSPADTGSSAALDLAKNSGVPVFYLNIVGKGDYTGMVMTNEQQGGNNAGKWALDYIDANLGGKATCAIITYDEITQCVSRAEGFKEIVLKQDGVKVVAEQTYSGDSERAAAVTQDFLTQFPDLDIVFAVGDPAAVAATEIIKAQGAKTIVIGYDANPEAYAAIKDPVNGRIWLADIAQDPNAQARKVVDLIIDYLNGKDIQKDNYVDTFVVDKEYIEKNGL